MATLHYHIRWSTKEDLDWQAFDTAAEAESAAANMVQSGETYTVEEVDEICSRCNEPRPEPKSTHTASPRAQKRGAG